MEKYTCPHCGNTIPKRYIHVDGICATIDKEGMKFLCPCCSGIVSVPMGILTRNIKRIICFLRNIHSTMVL